MCDVDWRGGGQWSVDDVVDDHVTDGPYHVAQRHDRQTTGSSACLLHPVITAAPQDDSALFAPRQPNGLFYLLTCPGRIAKYSA